MDHDEREPLLKDRYGSSDSERGSPGAASKTTVIQPKRTIIVEPVFLGFCIALIGSVPVTEQYLYARFEKQYPILVNGTNESAALNGTGPCSHVNTSDPYYIAIQKVQAETSNWMMYFQVLASLLALFTTLIYGAFSDHYGRRLVLALPCAAAAIKFVLNCFIIMFDLPVYLFLIGQVVDGLGGGFSTLTAVVFAYLADTTTTQQRGMRLLLAETCLTLALAISQLGLGYFIKAAGFFYPYLTLTLIIMITLLYLYFFVPETVVRNKESSMSVTGSLRQSYAVFTEKGNSRNVKLFFLTLAVVLYTFPLQSRFTLQILYTQNVPLCWGSVEIGIYQAVSALVIQFGGIAGLKLFKIFGISETWVAVSGCLSLIAGGLVNAWAQDLSLMLTVAAASVLLMVSVPMFRSITSRLVRQDEQGKLFSGIGCLEALASLVSAIVMNLIYQKTLYFMRGFVFIVGAMFGVLTIGVIVILVCLFGRDLSVPKETVVIQDEDGWSSTSPGARQE